MAKILVSGRLKWDSIEEMIGPDHEITIAETAKKLDGDLPKIINQYEAFVILPNSDPILVTSIIVAKQFDNPTVLNKDENGKYRRKPLIIFDQDKISPYVGMIMSMRKRNFIKQPFDQLCVQAKALEEIRGLLKHHIYDAKPLEIEASHEEDFFNYDKEYVRKLNEKADARPDHDFKAAVFCSASNKERYYLDIARETGRIIGEENWGFVCGAGNVSMMGESSREAKSFGSKVEGVTIPAFFERELKMEGNPEYYVDHLDVVDDIYERINLMFEKSDVLIVLPGGVGTVQEAAAALANKKNIPAMSKKRILFLNKDGFWDDLQTILEEAGYEHKKDFRLVSNEAEMHEQMKKYANQKKEGTL
jgi:uncharacterized protein (TIGR00730 family)